MQYTWIKSAGSAYELIIPWLYVPERCIPLHVVLTTDLQGSPTAVSGARLIIYVIRIDFELFFVSCIIIEDNASVWFICWDEGFLYLVWYDGLWFGLAQYIPFDSTLLEEERGQREEWWGAGIAAGQASENSREACTVRAIEYVTVRMVTKYHCQRNFRIILLFLSTGYMEPPGPPLSLTMWLSEKFSEVRIKPGTNLAAGSRVEHSPTPHLSLSPSLSYLDTQPPHLANPHP